MDKVQAAHGYSEGLHAMIQYTIYPTEDDMNVDVPYLDITSLRAIYRILSKSHFPNMNLSFYTEDSPT